MATNNGDTLNDVLHFGSWGNGSKAEAKHNFANEAQDDVVRMAIIPAGTKVLDLKAFFEAFGALRTIDLGYAAKDPDSSLVADPDYWTPSPIDVSAAGADRSNTGVPVVFDEDVYLTATLAGAAGADADLSVVLDYIYQGNL